MSINIGRVIGLSVCLVAIGLDHSGGSAQEPAPQEHTYAAIDGMQLKQYVNEYTAISRRYRDQGHQFWGRITGTDGDRASQQWLLEKFRKIGLTNVHEQAFDLQPQWMPQSWRVVVKGTPELTLESAQPTYLTAATPTGGLDIEAAYVGMGSDAEFADRDVRGKAVFIYSVPLPSMLRHTAATEGAVKRAEDKGAAAIFIVLALPGNIRTQMYPQGSNVPTFSMGLEDGMKVRDLIGRAQKDRSPRVSIRLDTKMVDNLKTATVWGELPGNTDENVMVIGHRDGWFEGGTDNASGVATMLGLAQYFAAIPKAQRRRTIQFLGTTGHHDTRMPGSDRGAESTAWLAAHKELFAKTALLINCEHTAVTQTYVAGRAIRTTTKVNPLFWYVGGSPRLVDVAVRAFDRFQIARYTDPEGNPPGEIGRLYRLAPSIQLIDIGMLNHSDHETADMVAPKGLAAVTRAYAAIIDESNEMSLGELSADRPTDRRNP